MENSNYQTQEPKNPTLWKIAKKRAAFKRHLLSYILVNLFLWLLWLFTWRGEHVHSIWPIYVTLGWGIGILFNFIEAYFSFKETLAQKEYDKLVKQ
jgi:hypothetical protein